MSTMVESLSAIGLIPVVQISDPSAAVPIARALVNGGIACAEITFRTDAAAEAMARISAEVPELLLGAGTVITTEQVTLALAAGARFIVSPGLNPTIVRDCLQRDIPIIPGICTPSELEQAIALGLTAVKFFPAESCGGIATLRAISAAYPSVRFMPTGGINPSNLNDYLGFSKVIACGGSWLTPAKAIEAGNYAEITRLAREAVRTMLGCKLQHIGINGETAAEAEKIANLFCALFSLDYLPAEGCIFAGDMVEAMKKPGRGKHGHIAVQVNDLPRAIAYFNRMGFATDAESCTYDEKGAPRIIYFKQEIGGFAIHLTQKRRA